MLQSTIAPFGRPSPGTQGIIRAPRIRLPSRDAARISSLQPGGGLFFNPAQGTGQWAATIQCSRRKVWNVFGAASKV